jgi:alpha-L-fucosidase
LPLTRLPEFVEPGKFDANVWVSLAKSAGMKYITITSRHHDGFAMFDSKISDWNIVKRIRYGKDPLRMLADECHRQGSSSSIDYLRLSHEKVMKFARRSVG